MCIRDRLKYTRRYSVLEEGDMAVVKADGIRFYDEMCIRDREQPLSLAIARQLPYRGEPLAKRKSLWVKTKLYGLPRPLLDRRGGTP